MRPVRPVSAESTFPLEGRGLVLGLVAGGLVGLIGLSIQAGFAVAVLLWTVCGLWRRAEPPVLSFCLAMQWVSIVTGVAYAAVTGVYPGQEVVGDTETATWLSLAGLLCLAAGIRLAMLRFGPERRPREGVAAEPRYDVRKLCWYVVAVYTANWFVALNPKVLGGGAEIVANLLLTRVVLLCFLVATVLRQREGYALAGAGFAYALLPLFASAMSDFKEFFFLMGLMLLRRWQPWETDPQVIEDNRRILAASAVLSVLLLFMGLLWEGAIKPQWRPIAVDPTMTSSPVDRLSTFASVAGEALVSFDTGEAIQALAGRLSSGAAYFSLVLARVPAVLPHEDGELTKRALLHVAQPRLLFPDKPVLVSDSWLVRTYTGLSAAGEEFGTSIGLGYMPQFYIDFGAWGLLFALFFYGIYLGILYRVMRSCSPPGELFGCAVAVLFVQHFITYDAEIAKQFGGLTQTFLIFSVLLRFVGPSLLRRLVLSGNAAVGPGGGAGSRAAPVSVSRRG